MHRILPLALIVAVAACAARAGEPPKAKPPAAAKDAPEWKKQLIEGQKLFDAGKFKEALVQLQKAFEENPGDMHVNWYLGRAAYETKDYETAVMAFERMLILAKGPKEKQRIRLELARSYFMLGLHDLARQEFTRVLDQKPPAVVEQNIRKFLDVMDKAKKRHFFSGMFSIATHWDSNPRVAPGNEDVKTILGDVLLDPTAQEEKDTYQSATASLQHKYRLGDRGFFIKSTAILYGTMYDDMDEQNVMFASGRSGFAYETKDLACEVALQYSHLTKDDDDYVNIYGVNVSATRVFTPKVMGNLAFRYDNKDYEEPLDYKDAETLDFTGRVVVLLGKNRIFPNIGYEVEEADHDEESYQNLHMGIAYERDLFWGLTAGASYGFKEMDYEAKQGLFDKKRHDEIHDLALSLTKKIGKHFEVQVSHAWTETHSNIELYEYDRRVLTLGVTFKF